MDSFFNIEHRQIERTVIETKSGTMYIFAENQKDLSLDLEPVDPIFHLRKPSGRNANGSGYTSSPCRMALSILVSKHVTKCNLVGLPSICSRRKSISVKAVFGCEPMMPIAS